MSQDNPIRIFVTHCFTENEDYTRVFEFLEGSTNFFYRNCSNPDATPPTGGIEALKDELRRQITLAEAIIVLESAFLHNMDLVTFQMNAAQALDKPLLAMERYGQVGEIRHEISARADGQMPWNERMMVDLIRREARHETTQRWDVLEFKL